MISLTNQVILARPGRCGGTEATRRLNCLEGPAMKAHLKLTCAAHHVPLGLYKQNLPAWLWKSMTLVMLVRDPYERALSTHNYWYWHYGWESTTLKANRVGPMVRYLDGLTPEEIERVEFIRMETYEDDLARLAEKFGWDVAPRARANAVPKGRILYPELTAEQRAEAAEVFAPDFDRFGYTR